MPWHAIRPSPWIQASAAAASSRPTPSGGLVSNPATSKIVDRDAFYGRVGYVYGGAIDKPLVVLRQDYGDRRVSEYWSQLPYRRFQPFALYPQWDLRGEPSIGTAAEGGKSYCEMDQSTKRCTYALAWTQVWAPTGKRIDGLMKGWTGSLLQDKREPNGLLYRRNRYLDPASGRFTQPDPIGLAGGLNSYGYAAGDPVNYADPFGLCPTCERRPVRPGVMLGAALNGVSQIIPHPESAEVYGSGNVGTFVADATANTNGERHLTFDGKQASTDLWTAKVGARAIFNPVEDPQHATAVGTPSVLKFRGVNLSFVAVVSNTSHGRELNSIGVEVGIGKAILYGDQFRRFPSVSHGLP